MKIKVSGIEQKEVQMPVKKIGKMYRWGKHGKKYKTRKEAIKQAQAAYAHGYMQKTGK
jgi:hypothetical protein